MRLQPRWALFISGQGSNMSAVLDQNRDKGTVALVVSSSPTNFGLKRARRLGIPTLVLDKKIDWTQLQQQLEGFGISHIFLLGFMKIVPQSFLQKWTRPILNVHPSLLPSYPGLNSFQRAYDDKSPLGVTVHHVIPDVDAGAIVMQKEVIESTESTSKFREDRRLIEQRVHHVEYHLVRKTMMVAACWM